MSSAGIIAWLYYLKKFNKVIERYKITKILKTDCNNEAFSHPKYGGLVKNLTNHEKLDIQMVEYDSSVITRALGLFPDLEITQGDIRNLPYKDNSFDLVADFSTIDHVPDDDVYTALKGYLRVTKSGGYIIVICWFAYRKSDVISSFGIWNSTDQYFLWERDIIDFLSKNGTKVVETETIVNINYKYAADHWAAVDKNQNPKYYLKYILVKKIE
jgi:SAM-dependent methyltransferase